MTAKHMRIVATIQAPFNDPVPLVLNSGRYPIDAAQAMVAIGTHLTDGDHVWLTTHSIQITILDDQYADEQGPRLGSPDREGGQRTDSQDG